MSGMTLLSRSRAAAALRKPNVVFVFADQWRAQATGYAGDPNLQGKTPNLDRLAGESVDLINAVSTVPVCTPFRASMLTGQYALTHGLFMNDAPLNPACTTIGKVLKTAGYNTGYVGKWHVDGPGRSSYIPLERHQGFDYWKVLECTHNYNHSAYYEGNDPTKKWWKGYDAFAQTADVGRYIVDHAQDEKPFAIFLSWGPPHSPYSTAPEEYKALFHAGELQLHPNVPVEDAKAARKYLAGYYAHIAALDNCIGELIDGIDQAGLRDKTIVVFTADHGAMLQSHGQHAKQQPYDESVRVPFLIRFPDRFGLDGKKVDLPFGTPDIMPSLLGLCGIAVPASVEGSDYSRALAGEATPDNDAVLIECPAPFGQWRRSNGGREYRGMRTRRYTYVRSLDGPWLLFDNKNDPYQMRNLVDSPEHKALREKLDAQLSAKLRKRDDEFLPADAYIQKWGYTVDNTGTISYTN